eukprot:gnl/Chilomastix_cuspidata/161.p1 GENE.gnl/Chilomastix_cuspidata/161~~gnl/Chilomastix_cuspidata/161.p1  ORF type:complete len:594 (+),score=254.36 gnl/Chilomastix_cuspidata/161:187-1968(+)
MNNIRLHILSAKNAPAADSSTSDPYVKVFQKFGEKSIQVAQTKVIKKDLNPVWNEHFDLCGLRGLDFTFKLFDHDRIGSDDPLGSVKFKANSPLFPFGTEVALRVRVKDAYKTQFSAGRECHLLVKVETFRPHEADMKKYTDMVKAATLAPGQSVTHKVDRKSILHGYLHYDLDGEIDRLVAYKKPINKMKDLTKVPVVLPPGWVAPPPPNFMSVPFVELNCGGFTKKGKPETACYAGDVKEKGVKHSGWSPLFTPEGNFASGFRFRPNHMVGPPLERHVKHVLSAFLRFPMNSWAPFHNLRFTLVDIGDSKKELRKGLADVSLKSIGKVIASIPVVPNPACGGVFFACLEASSSKLRIEAPTPAYPMGPEISWIPRSFMEVLPETLQFAFGFIPGSHTRKTLSYPNISLDISSALAMAGVRALSAFQVGLGWDTTTDLDASIIPFGAALDTLDICYFGRRSVFGGALSHHGDNLTGAGSGDDEKITVDLTKLPPTVNYIVVTINSFSGVNFKSVKKAYGRIVIEGKEIIRVNLTKTKKKTAVAVACFFRIPDTPNGWSFIQFKHFCDGRTAASVAEILKSYLQGLRASRIIP